MLDDFALREHTAVHPDDLYQVVSDRAVNGKPPPGCPAAALHRARGWRDRPCWLWCQVNCILGRVRDIARNALVAWGMSAQPSTFHPAHCADDLIDAYLEHEDRLLAEAAGDATGAGEYRNRGDDDVLAALIAWKLKADDRGKPLNEQDWTSLVLELVHRAAALRR
ncbi:hypothetical protein [Mycobacterium sp. DL99]|uniref:hypothetical protein n=1 Tax=Mycobacterium sp. DL99 TaxID=2528957 RepID=UPI001080F397|nr:hypothetical protein [Mycobacterium sp. DL99]